MSLNICVIASDTWFPVHLTRWVRFVRQNVREPKLYLFVVGDNISLRNPILREFETVKYYPAECLNRKWLNTVRMSATTIFGVDEILYIDCDCDIMTDISDVRENYKKDLVCVKSPLIHKTWAEISQELYHTLPQREFNNGFLYMRKDWGKEYEEAWAKVEKCAPPDRIIGTMAFNAMLMDHEGKWESADYTYSVIWHDVEELIAAKTIQYCNDEGQAKRERLEEIWRNAYL